MTSFVFLKDAHTEFDLIAFIEIVVEEFYVNTL